MGTLPLPVARRRQAGLLLCADACLMFAGQSHENGRVMKRDDQCPGIDDFDTGGSFNIFSRYGGSSFRPLLPPAFSLSLIPSIPPPA